MTTPQLLQAALRRDWQGLSIDTGLSRPRLAQMALRAIDDPDVIAQYPLECGQLRRRRDAARSARGGH